MRLIRLIIGIIPMFYGMSNHALTTIPFLGRCGLVFVGGYIAFTMIYRSKPVA